MATRCAIGIPMFPQIGYPDIQGKALLAVVATAGTTAHVVGLLNDKVNEVLAMPVAER
jgi:hypothetical protein